MGILFAKPLPRAEKRVRFKEPIQEVVRPKRAKIVSKPQLQLVHIYNDCLIDIFDYLSMDDLINVADTHASLVPAARTVFMRRYRTKFFYLNLGIVRFNDEDCVEIHQDIAVSLFRHFGAALSSLFINFEGHHERAIEKSFLDNCTNTLTKLDLALCQPSNLNDIEDSFRKVEHLTITKSLLGENLSRLYVWFPYLTTLKLLNCTTSKPQYLAAHFPHLKHLVIYNEKMTIPLASIVGLLRANPQLVSLVLNCDYDFDFLQLASEYLRRLTELELWAPDDRFISFDDETVRFESIEKFTLVASKVRGEFVVNMPFAFGHLKALTLDGFNEFKGHLIKFIKANRGIQQLNLIPCIDDWDDLTFEDLMSIINALPDLVELEFCGDTFEEEDIVQLLMTNKQLQTVRVSFIDVPIWPDFVPAIKTEWTLTVFCTSESTHFFELDRIEGNVEKDSKQIEVGLK